MFVVDENKCTLTSKKRRHPLSNNQIRITVIRSFENGLQLPRERSPVPINSWRVEDFSKNHVDLLTRDVCRRESRFKSSRQEEYAHLDTGTDAPEKPSPSWQLPARGNSAAVRDPDSRTLPFLLHSVPPQPLLENGLQSERQTRRCAVPLRYICFGPRTASYWFINIPDRRLY